MPTFRASAVAFLLAILAASALGLVRGTRPAAAVDETVTMPSPAPMPTGAEGELIRYGRSLITDTKKYAGSYITSNMSCAACHIDAGTKAHGGSFVGIYANFPQWNKRAKRFITFDDRLSECFLYSMNGRPPPSYSREVTAMTAYIAWLSRGAEVGKGFPGQGFVTVNAAQPPDKLAGEKIYTAKCAACHGANGAGNSAANFPPLWGAKLPFNDGAGMNTKMPAFVKANMPVGEEGSLSDQDAVDVSAYVLSHARPHFDRNRPVTFPPKPAGYF